MQAGYALIEFNYVRTLATDSAGVTHTMFCGEIL